MTWNKRYGNKYGAKKTEYNGIYYHSKKEAGYAQYLDTLLAAKKIKGWKRQVKLSLDVNGYHITNYFIDFEVEHNDGIIEYIEVKGYETMEWQLKWKLTEALYNKEIQNGKVKITVVK